jgi:capsular polysaccharide transport system permease protein
VPSIAATIYYSIIASPQYVSTAQFAIRGISETASSFLSVASVLGSSSQSYDSYIIVEYIRSVQMIRDVAQSGIDLRSFYAQDGIDPVEKIDPTMPLEYFTGFWSRKVDVSYNSTTGNIIFRVRAFSAQDAKTIADAVMAAAERLVSQLSANARTQLVSAAQDEVTSTEQRLANVRQQFSAFRDLQQAVDAEQLAQIEQTVISELERQLSELQTRRGSISASLSANSPTIRVLDQQIASVNQQLAERRSRVGTGTANTDGKGDPLLSDIVNQFRELSLSQEYAETAYTRALGSLETALLDARKQDRYFAVFEAPHQPEVPTAPNRLFFIALFIVGSLIVWGILVLIVGAVKEHNL